MHIPLGPADLMKLVLKRRSEKKSMFKNLLDFQKTLEKNKNTKKLKENIERSELSRPRSFTQN